VGGTWDLALSVLSALYYADALRHMWRGDDDARRIFASCALSGAGVLLVAALLLDDAGTSTRAAAAGGVALLLWVAWVYRYSGSADAFFYARQFNESERSGAA